MSRIRVAALGASTSGSLGGLVHVDQRPEFPVALRCFSDPRSADIIDFSPHMLIASNTERDATTDVAMLLDFTADVPMPVLLFGPAAYPSPDLPVREQTVPAFSANVAEAVSAIVSRLAALAYPRVLVLDDVERDLSEVPLVAELEGISRIFLPIPYSVRYDDRLSPTAVLLRRWIRRLAQTPPGAAPTCMFVDINLQDVNEGVALTSEILSADPATTVQPLSGLPHQQSEYISMLAVWAMAFPGRVGQPLEKKGWPAAVRRMTFRTAPSHVAVAAPEDIAVRPREPAAAAAASMVAGLDPGVGWRVRGVDDRGRLVFSVRGAVPRRMHETELLPLLPARVQAGFVEEMDPRRLVDASLPREQAVLVAVGSLAVEVGGEIACLLPRGAPSTVGHATRPLIDWVRLAVSGMPDSHWWPDNQEALTEWLRVIGKHYAENIFSDTNPCNSLYDRRPHSVARSANGNYPGWDSSKWIASVRKYRIGLRAEVYARSELGLTLDVQADGAAIWRCWTVALWLFSCFQFFRDHASVKSDTLRQADRRRLRILIGVVGLTSGGAAVTLPGTSQAFDAVCLSLVSPSTTISADPLQHHELVTAWRALIALTLGAL